MKQTSLLEEIEQRETDKWREKRDKMTGVVKVLMIPANRCQEFLSDLLRYGAVAVES